MAKDPLKTYKLEHVRAEQLASNCRWLIGITDAINRELCPDKIGTWQERAKYALETAQKIGKNKFKKCTQCGTCCKEETCAIGLAIFGDNKPCKALEFIRSKYYCGLVKKSSKYLDSGKPAKWKDAFWKKFFSNVLGINKGCCSSLE